MAAVITGLGSISPVGSTLETTWQNLQKQTSFVQGLAGRFETHTFERLTSQVAGQVLSPLCLDNEKPIDWKAFVGAKKHRQLDPFIHLGLFATAGALKDAGLIESSSLNTEVQGVALERVAVCLTSAFGGIQTLEKAFDRTRQDQKPLPSTIPASLINMLGGEVALSYGFVGGNFSAVSACSSSAHALGFAKHLIDTGQADIVIAGGSEACLTPTILASFASAKSLTTQFNQSPQKASRAFDKDRDGFVMAEGAACLIVESEKHAHQRGVEPYARLSGFAMNGDAHHATSPNPEGEHTAKCMQKALLDAGLEAKDISYINAHATSTPLGDIAESRAIKKVFGHHKPLVSSTKSITGHLLGASGAIEALFTTLMMKHNQAIGNVNLDHQDPLCEIDCLPKGVHCEPLKACLSNSFGFGGTNVSLVFEAV